MYACTLSQSKQVLRSAVSLSGRHQYSMKNRHKIFAQDCPAYPLLEANTRTPRNIQSLVLRRKFCSFYEGRPNFNLTRDAVESVARRDVSLARKLPFLCRKLVYYLGFSCYKIKGLFFVCFLRLSIEILFPFRQNSFSFIIKKYKYTSFILIGIFSFFRRNLFQQQQSTRRKQYEAYLSR